jgi:signal transduction histidine kinase
MTTSADNRESLVLPLAGKVRPRVLVMFAVLLIFIIGIIDLWIEPQLSSTFFYLLPVLLVSRHAGLWASIGCAALATVMSLIANLVTSHHDRYPFIPYSDAALRFGVLLVMVRLVRSLRALNDTLDRRVRDRTARLEAEVKERLKLENRIIEASESEQSRIGQDLHDGLCQYLVATAFSAGLLQRKLEDDRLPEAAAASEIVGMIDESITQARDLAKGLYPVPLEEEGLETALRDLAAKTSKRTGIECHVHTTGPPSQLEKDAAIHLYRISQEALNNSIKHSGANSVDIGFKVNGNRFELVIEDDGCGIAPGARGEGGMGLHIMAYRARVIGATVAVARGKAGGTLVRCASTAPSESTE